MKNALRLFVLVLAIALCHTAAEAASYEPSLEQWRAFSQTSDARLLAAWLHRSLESCLTDGKGITPPKMTLPPFDGRLGLFITLMKKNKVRGCFGAFNHPNARIEELLTDYLKGALRRDHRYLPVDEGDLPDITIILTIAGRRVPVRDIADVDIVHYGILATFEGDAHDVIVPAEIRSLDALKSRWRGRQIHQIEVFGAITIK